MSSEPPDLHAVPLLVLIELSTERLQLLQSHFEVIYAPDAAQRQPVLAEHGSRIRAVLTNGPVGLGAADIDALPALALIGSIGAGYENIDLHKARERSVTVVSGTGANKHTVADHAWALLLALVRQIPYWNQRSHAAQWDHARTLLPDVSFRRLGILGLGAIGHEIARRGEGFNLSVGYHSRQEQNVAYRYFDSAASLAAWSDYLVLALPDTPQTRRLIGAPELKALGRDGYLVNIARGSVLDTDALTDALKTGAIAGAALDVFENEPHFPQSLTGLGNVLLTPHQAGLSPDAFRATTLLFIENARLFFTGKPVLTPVLN